MNHDRVKRWYNGMRSGSDGQILSLYEWLCATVNCAAQLSRIAAQSLQYTARVTDAQSVAVALHQELQGALCHLPYSSCKQTAECVRHSSRTTGCNRSGLALSQCIVHAALHSCTITFHAHLCYTALFLYLLLSVLIEHSGLLQRTAIDTRNSHLRNLTAPSTPPTTAPCLTPKERKKTSTASTAQNTCQ